MTTIVAAMGRNNEIGGNNRLLWHLPKDLKHFKEITSGHPVIMGRKTFESIGKALPNRTNIVVSANKEWFQEGILIVGSLKEAVKFAKKIDAEIFIIGGGEIYRQTMDICDRLEITKVDADFRADTFFPEIDPAIWQKTSQIYHEKDEKHAFDFSFETWEKIPQENDLKH